MKRIKKMAKVYNQKVKEMYLIQVQINTEG